MLRPMESCLYEGFVHHRRTSPVEHEFRVRLSMAYLDLAELPQVFAGRWLWKLEGRAPASFHRSDYLGDPATPLPEAVRDCVERRTGRRPGGPIRLLTHLRTFGFCFNPVSFYYCYEPSSRRLESIVADVTNTPWKERHAYVLSPRPEEPRGSLRFETPKAFHVSPFMSMDLDYHWRVATPGERLLVAIANHDADGRFFQATLALERREITARNLARSLAAYPFATGRVVAGIYWQALRLRAKGAHFFSHPDPAAGSRPRRRLTHE